MGTVYLAEQLAVGRKVAIKVLNDSLARDSDFVARFIHEARTLAQLQHPNIVALYDAAFEDGQAFIVMEYVDADGLDAVLKTRRLAPDDIRAIGSQVADALEYAHQRGVIHRDVKPSNILVQASGRAVLTDFGVARLASGTRLTQWGSSVGTPEYMSPEQVQGGAVDGRSDIYSLGVVLYEMASGSPPFTGDTLGVLHQHVYQEPIKLQHHGLPKPLQDAIDGCLAKDPARRYSSASMLAAALRGEQRIGSRMRPSAPARSSPKGSPGLVVGLGGAAAALLVALVVAFAARGQPQAGAPSKAVQLAAVAPASQPAPSAASTRPIPTPTPIVLPTASVRQQPQPTSASVVALPPVILPAATPSMPKPLAVTQLSGTTFQAHATGFRPNEAVTARLERVDGGPCTWAGQACAWPRRADANGVYDREADFTDVATRGDFSYWVEGASSGPTNKVPVRLSIQFSATAVSGTLLHVRATGFHPNEPLTAYMQRVDGQACVWAGQPCVWQRQADGDGIYERDADLSDVSSRGDFRYWVQGSSSGASNVQNVSLH